ncbi:hypothetical protein C8J57DRAFT_1319467 [Mycena rebaudengoi]|nr:hypothetical protein C8J57DRAFT_1319467 [Mycena rebaudengoi]
MTSLVFTKPSMLNTTIKLDSIPVYTLSTRLPGLTTNIRSAHTSELVGRMSRRIFLPDTVTLPNGKTLRVSRWLKETKMADGSPARLLHLDGEPRFLTQHSDYGLALFEANAETIVAHWQPATKSSELALVLSPGMEQFQTKVLVAFLLVEQERRANEKKPMDVTTAATGYMKGPGGGY